MWNAASIIWFPPLEFVSTLLLALCVVVDSCWWPRCLHDIINLIENVSKKVLDEVKFSVHGPSRALVEKINWTISVSACSYYPLMTKRRPARKQKNIDYCAERGEGCRRGLRLLQRDGTRRVKYENQSLRKDGLSG